MNNYQIDYLNLEGINLEDNFQQQENINLISVTLLVFQFEISGKDDNDEQL